MLPDRALVDRYGSDVTAEQTLNPDLHRWRLPDALVAYAVGHRWPGGPRVRITAGGPVCAPDQMGNVIAAFERDASASGDGVGWFAVSDSQRRAMAEGAPVTDLAIGAQPMWTPTQWPAIVASKASVRAQIHRAQNKGVRVQVWPPSRAQDDPTLAQVVTRWLSRRGLPALRFLADPQILGHLGHRRVVVAHWRERCIGYLLLAPIPAQRGVFIEWIIRSPEAPNGTAALLVDAAFHLAMEDGARLLSMGLVPLSTHAPPSAVVPPVHVRTLLLWMRAHSRRFYNFEGLEQFKAKFQPEAWEPLYLLTREPRITFGLLHAVADAFAGARSPEALIGRALAVALRDEATAAGRWLSRRGS